MLPKTFKRKNIFFGCTIISIVIIFCITAYANNFIVEKSKTFITSNIDSVHQSKVGLLLGTTRFLKSGYENEYFFNRIQATVDLFNGKKISYVIVSGDNSRKDYNEPLDMKNELIKNGVPDTVIYLDYAGLRTLD